MNLPEKRDQPPPRRSFMTTFLALVTGGVAVMIPVLASLGVVLHPLRRRRRRRAGTASGPGSSDPGSNGAGATGGSSTDQVGQRVPICSLAMLPDDGIPRQFPVIADVVDAWSKTPKQQIGSVFLMRSPAASTPELVAYQADCPHLGCRVDYNPQTDEFQCPCHVSGFALDGSCLYGPSPRGLDELPVEIVDDEIWVTYQRFASSIAEKVPIG